MLKQKLKSLLGVVTKRWNEYLPFLVALPAWWFSSKITRLIDPTAAVDDAGLFQALIFGVVLYFGACAFSWAAMRTVFPIIGKWVDDMMGVTFTAVKRETQLMVAVVMFAIYFIGAVVIFASVV